MHFINVTESMYGRKQEFSGFILEFTPLFPANPTASVAVYTELWHRLRRDNKLKCQKDKALVAFDAVLLFNGSTPPEKQPITGAVHINTVAPGSNTPAGGVDAEKIARRALHYLDSLLYDLFEDPNQQHADSLDYIARRFEIGDKAAATQDLKTFLKIYCRGQGLFIDQNDVYHAIAREKERRRQDYNNRPGPPRSAT